MVVVQVASYVLTKNKPLSSRVTAQTKEAEQAVVLAIEERHERGTITMV